MIGLIFWAFVLILALSYFGITVQDIVNSPTGQANSALIWNLLSQAWHAIANFLNNLGN